VIGRLGLVCLSLVLAAPAVAAPGADPVGRLLALPIPDDLRFCGEPVPVGREDVAERIDLELMDTLASPMRTALWLKRVPRHLPAIEESLRRRGLPEDLKYVAIIESNLRDDAVSGAGAVGPWQFMRGTASAYGLERSEWRDPLRDWEASTEAALAHLAELRGVFPSWPLALAAYNAGRGRVTRALESQGEADFYGLKLPRETERYVFRAVAAKLVLENPAAYGIDVEGARLYPPENAVAAEVKVERGEIPVWALARASGLSYRQFLRLNPSLVAAELPRGTHRLAVPAQAAAGMQEAVARWEAENPEPREVKTVRVKVKGGDTLSTIARRHSVSVDDLRAWNKIGAKGVLRKGQELVVQMVD